MVSLFAVLLCFRNDTNPKYEDPITDGKEGKHQRCYRPHAFRRSEPFGLG